MANHVSVAWCKRDITYFVQYHNMPVWCQAITLKWKGHHFDEIFITGCTGSCHFDNFQYSQWWKFHQNEDISTEVYLNQSWKQHGNV